MNRIARIHAGHRYLGISERHRGTESLLKVLSLGATMDDASRAVSVCIPTYNSGHYLADALDSALAQRFEDIEILVIDNCSEDDTPGLVEEYCRRDARVVFHRNARNLGMTANFNRCLELASGRFVKFLCADDVLREDCVGAMNAALRENPAVALVCCRRSLFRDDGQVIRTVGYSRGPMILGGNKAIHDCFFRGNLIGEPTAVMFRKADAKSGFDESYGQALDLEMWFRLVEGRRLMFLPEALCGTRQHPSQGTATNLRTGRIVRDKVRLFQEYSRKPYLRGSLWERLLWDLRMASSVGKQAAAGSAMGKEAAADGLYFPAFTRRLLIPAVSTLMRFRAT